MLLIQYAQCTLYSNCHSIGLKTDWGLDQTSQNPLFSRIRRPDGIEKTKCRESCETAPFTTTCVHTLPYLLFLFLFFYYIVALLYVQEMWQAQLWWRDLLGVKLDGQPLARKLVLTPHHPLILHTQPVRTLETNICPGHHTFTLVSSWNRNVCRFLVFIKHCRVEWFCTFCDFRKVSADQVYF